MIGTALRVAVIAAWLAAMSSHAARHWPGASAERAPALAERVGQRLTYAVLSQPTAGGPGAAGSARMLGSCAWRCERDGDGLRVIVEAELADIRPLPGFGALARALDLDQDGPQPATLALTERYARGGTLDAVDARAQALGLEGTATLTLSDTGVLVRWDAAGAVGERRFPVTGNSTAALIIAALPARLRVGDRFAIPVLGGDQAALAPRARAVRFEVVAEEESATALGQRLLLRVEARDDDARGAVWWCDEDGLVHRQRLPAAALVLELRSVAADAGSAP